MSYRENIQTKSKEIKEAGMTTVLLNSRNVPYTGAENWFLKRYFPVNLRRKCIGCMNIKARRESNVREISVRSSENHE